ncbi:DUF481 domain-containing protein [Pararhodonellum marinum]|uniref:DUF481 domain-containing protein n=1 Tax=Pararhodonellum marinum TaxID=2755358 RepID=UPI001E570224|nr:DUF481 domain-containing protein [Pararhodonellum marinum]
MKRITFLLLFFTFTASQAQILNIERYRLEKDTTKNFMFKATAGLNVFNRSAASDAPVNLFGYKWDVNAVYFPGKHSFIFVSNFDYLRINENDFLNFGLIHGRVVFNREKITNIETFAQYSFDNFRGLEPRWVMGGTLRYQAVKSDRMTLILGMGAIYEHETWIHPFTEEDVQIDFFKSSNYVSLRMTISPNVDINTVTYYQVGYDQGIEAFRNRINSTINLNTKITDRFSFNNTFEFAYEDRPIVPITPFIFAFRMGISLDF